MAPYFLFLFTIATPWWNSPIQSYLSSKSFIHIFNCFELSSLSRYLSFRFRHTYKERGADAFDYFNISYSKRLLLVCHPSHQLVLKHINSKGHCKDSFLLWIQQEKNYLFLFHCMKYVVKRTKECRGLSRGTSWHVLNQQRKSRIICKIWHCHLPRLSLFRQKTWKLLKNFLSLQQNG